MARQVIWTAAASTDLDEIEAYIAPRSPSGARRVIERLRDAADRQREFPYAARMIPEFQNPDRRETIVYDYQVVYRVEPNGIRILRVVHGRRLLKNVPGSFEESPQAPYGQGPPPSAPEHAMEDAIAIAEKPKLSAKDEVRALLDRLPDSVTLEDIAYHLDVVIKVLEAEADTSGGVPHVEAKRRFAQWFAQ